MSTVAASPAQPGKRHQIMPFAALTAAYCAHAGFFNPFLPLWLKDLGLSLVVISVLTSVQAATRMFAPYAWGTLSDRTGERAKLLRWGALTALVASAGLWFNGGAWWLAAVLLIMFTQTSGMMPMTEAAVAHVVSQGGSFDTKLYGRVRLWGSLGFMLAVLGAGAWFEHVGMRSFPLIVSVSLVVLVVFAYRMPDVKEAHHATAGAASLPMGPVLAQPAVRWLFASVFFHVLSHMGIYTFFSLYMDSLGYSKTMIGLLWAVSVTVEIGWFFTQSRWMPRVSLTGWLVLCALVMVFRMAVTASLASVLWVLVIAQALHALTFAAHHSACIALVSHHFPGSLRGRGQALYIIIGYGIPGVLGGLLGGQLSQHFGLGSVFWGTSVMAVLATACAYKVWRLRHPAALPAA
nr:MFS transporter [Rhodoferax sp. TH121]